MCVCVCVGRERKRERLSVLVETEFFFLETSFVKSKGMGQRYNISFYYYKKYLYSRMITDVSNCLFVLGSRGSKGKGLFNDLLVMQS